MHGTFPEWPPKRMLLPEAIEPWTTLVAPFALASIPLVLATLVAAVRFGGKISLAKIVGILVIATAATPM